MKERINRVRKEKGWGHLLKRTPVVAAEHAAAAAKHHYRRTTVKLKKDPSKVVSILGNKMKLDRNDSLELSVWGVYEPYETSLFQQASKPGLTALDIGANIGYYTLIMAKGIGPKGRIYAFEPDRENLSTLQENLGLNGYEKNVQVEQLAISDQAGALQLYVAEDNLGDHRAYETPGRKAVTVPTLSIDAYLKGQTVDLIKIDVQGAEGPVLKGMRKTIGKSKHLTVFTEFWPNGMRAAGFEPREAWDVLEGGGFKIENIRERERRLEPIDFETIERDYPDGTNLLCTK